MRVKQVWILVSLTVLCLFSSIGFGGTYGGGTGDPNTPFIISNADDMQEIGTIQDDWSKHFVLISDIDLSNFDGQNGRPAFNIIGNEAFPFTGVFDGSGHTISNFSYRTSEGDTDIGIFGYIMDVNALICNLTLLNVDVDADLSYNVGTLAGYLRQGTISNCDVNGGVVSGNYYVGGMIGKTSQAVLDCHTSVIVSGNQRIGGLIGYAYYNSYVRSCSSSAEVLGVEFIGGLIGVAISSNISQCFAITNVSGNNSVGGFIGTLQHGSLTESFSDSTVNGTESVGGLAGTCHYGDILDCYSKGIVSGYSYVGGFVGNGRGCISTSFSRNYSIASVTGTLYIGGFIGSCIGYPSACYWDIEVSGQSISDGGTGLTTAEMQTAGSFASWGSCGKDSVWVIQEGMDYPHLAWEGTPFSQPIINNINNYLLGTGIAEDPYLIYTAEDLHSVTLFPCEWDKHFKLMADVDLSAYTGSDFCLIGTNDFPFLGVFDGNKHIISNFTFLSKCPYCGLFGQIGYSYNEDPIVKDLGLISPNVSGSLHVGALAGYLRKATILRCFVQGGSVTAGQYVGGAVGTTTDGRIENVYSDCTVNGFTKNIGGLLGHLQSGILYYCYSAGTVTVDTDTTGGLVGQGSGTVADCFWDITTSGQASSDGGTGLTHAQMQAATSFSNWQCADAWSIDNGNDYPRLLWENMPGAPLRGYFYDGGNGDSNNPYLISTAEQLNLIGLTDCDLGKSFRLTNDIDISGYSGEQFNIIGTIYNEFTGVFDGDGYTISNFNYNCQDGVRIGLFGWITKSGKILNLVMSEPNIVAPNSSYVGSLAGFLEYGVIENCCVEGGSVIGCNYVGGLTGRSRGSIIQSYSDTNVVGLELVGGITGYTLGGSVRNCYSMAIVNGTNNVGGLIGLNSSAVVINNYSAGPVFGTSNIGAFVGYDNNGDYTQCFWDSTVNSSLDGIGNTRDHSVSGASTEDMQTEYLYVHGRWDFMGETKNGTDDIWSICEGMNYPLLVWQIPTGDFLCPDGVSFEDYSYLSRYWLENCNEANNYCDGIDLDGMGSVGLEDLLIFCANWLVGIK